MGAEHIFLVTLQHDWQARHRPCQGLSETLLLQRNLRRRTVVVSTTPSVGLIDRMEMHDGPNAVRNQWVLPEHIASQMKLNPDVYLWYASQASPRQLVRCKSRTLEAESVGRRDRVCQGLYRPADPPGHLYRAVLGVETGFVVSTCGHVGRGAYRARRREKVALCLQSPSHLVHAQFHCHGMSSLCQAEDLSMLSLPKAGRLASCAVHD